jgi:hypothetical protein
VAKLSGFTIVRNAIKLDFPLEASIRSLLPICDEVVVNVGRSDDETLALVQSIGNPRIRILETEWDMTIKNKVLGNETLRAMRACRHPWGIYIQADEVLHESGAERLARAVEEHDRDGRVEGLLVKYLHFYGDLDTIALNRRWYRREVRAVRLDPALDIRPYQGAQGFRVGPHHRKIRARLTMQRCSTTAGLDQPKRSDRSGRPARSSTPGPRIGRPDGHCCPGFPDSDRFGGPTLQWRGRGSMPGVTIPSAGSSRPASGPSICVSMRQTRSSV